MHTLFHAQVAAARICEPSNMNRCTYSQALSQDPVQQQQQHRKLDLAPRQQCPDSWEKMCDHIRKRDSWLLFFTHAVQRKTPEGKCKAGKRCLLCSSQYFMSRAAAMLLIAHIKVMLLPDCVCTVAVVKK